MNPTRRAIFGAAASAVVGARSAAKVVAETFAEAGLTTAVAMPSVGMGIGNPPGLAAPVPQWAMDAVRWRAAFRDVSSRREQDPNIAAIKSYSPVYRAMRQATSTIEANREDWGSQAWRLVKELGP